MPIFSQCQKTHKQKYNFGQNDRIANHFDENLALCYFLKIDKAKNITLLKRGLQKQLTKLQLLKLVRGFFQYFLTGFLFILST